MSLSHQFYYMYWVGVVTTKQSDSERICWTGEFPSGVTEIVIENENENMASFVVVNVVIKLTNETDKLSQEL